MDLITEIMINPGDVVVCEAPSYLGSLGIFRAYEAEVVQSPIDADGVIPQPWKKLSLAWSARAARLSSSTPFPTTTTLPGCALARSVARRSWRFASATTC